MFEWGGISVDPNRQVAIANPMALPFVSKLIPRGPRQSDGAAERCERLWYGVRRAAAVRRPVRRNAEPVPVAVRPAVQTAGLGGISPPSDLKTNEVVWKKRIGTPQDSLPFPMPVKLPFTMGMPMLGGPISTAGNVLFIGATADNYLRAYNMSNGEKLWEARLPAGGQATPMTYEVNGKQYVVISAGGHGSFGTKMGDYIVAYALPDDAK